MSLFDALVSSARREAHSMVQRWDPDGLEAACMGHVERHLARCDVRFGEEFMRVAPVPGCGPEHYVQRIVDLGSGRHVLLGPRFLGMDISHPFVDLIASTHPWAEIGSTLLAMFDSIYPWFSPEWLRVYRTVEGPPTGASVARADLHHVAGAVEELVGRPRPPRYGDLALEAARDLSWMEGYDAMYRRFHEDAPDLRVDVVPSSSEDLVACLGAEQLWLARLGETWVGVVGARPEQDGPLRGWGVVEEVLDRPFRGMGLGVAMQRHLLDRLTDDAGPLLHGTVHSTNVASLRTAARLGRRIVGTWWFVR